jgi:hypothetical protein
MTEGLENALTELFECEKKLERHQAEIDALRVCFFFFFFFFFKFFFLILIFNLYNFSLTVIAISTNSRIKEKWNEK